MRPCFLILGLSACTGANTNTAATKPISQTGQPPTSTSSIVITERSLGPLQTGKEISIDEVKNALPGAEVVPFGSNRATWRIKGAGWNGVADAKKIVLDSGPIALFGAKLGDQASAMGSSIADAYCFTEDGDPWVTCNLGALSLRFKGCEPTTRDEIPIAELGSCTLEELWWLAVLPPDGGQD